MIFYKFRLKSGRLVDTGLNAFWSPTLTAKDPEIPYLPLESPAVSATTGALPLVGRGPGMALAGNGGGLAGNTGVRR
jgi:hypothetical protein